ncbi:hypothetical protein [Streptomyces sp. NPDC052042]|uniref:hypothetical protein n=1 Tax=Streptomyces sp. NPDC052042 TaxID=3365683 RepID=UPI0037D46409
MIIETPISLGPSPARRDTRYGDARCVVPPPGPVAVVPGPHAAGRTDEDGHRPGRACRTPGADGEVGR